jgi:hypothetical protein
LHRIGICTGIDRVFGVVVHFVFYLGSLTLTAYKSKHTEKDKYIEQGESYGHILCVVRQISITISFHFC